MSISAGEFKEACHKLEQGWDYSRSETDGWLDVRVLEDFGTSYLRITKQLFPRLEHHANVAERVRDRKEALGEIHEIDDEVATPAMRHTHDGPRVVYDIVHSPSYQVPVLYVTLQSHDYQGWKPLQLPVDEVYSLLTPRAHHEQLRNIGVVGALSMTDHPISGLPVYFMHPCRTGEAMEAVVNSTEMASMKPEAYLMLWMGIIGSSVGLNMPVEIAARMTASDSASSSQ